MTSLTTKSVILFMCWVIIAQCSAEDLQISFWDVTEIVNGNFDNIDQSNDGNHDRIEFKVKPVLIPGLQQDPVLYGEEILNGYLYRRSVIVRNESSTDRILYTNYYNFTDASLHEAGTFNTDDLANLTRDDFRIEEGCQASYVQLFPGVLFVQGLDCRHSVNGKHPIYTSYWTCDSVRLNPPVASDETTSLVGYNLKRKGPRYPLIGAPEGSVNHCQDGP